MGLECYLDVSEQFPQAAGRHGEPGHAANGPGGIHDFFCVSVALHAHPSARAASRLHFAGGVVVQGEEIRRAQNGGLVGGEARQPRAAVVAQLPAPSVHGSPHHFRVIPGNKDGPGEPTEREREAALGGGLVLAASCPQRLQPVAVDGQRHGTALLGPVEGVVAVPGHGVGTEQVVARPVGGEARLPPPGGVDAVFVAQLGAHVRLVDGDPEFDAVAECLEAKLGVAVKHGGDTRPGPSSLVLESLRQVEVVERDHG